MENNYLSLFKNIFKDQFERIGNIDFEKTLQTLKSTYPLISFEDSHFALFREWYHSITDLEFLKGFFQNSFEEIIFHGSNQITYKDQSQKHFFEQFNFNTDDFHLALEILAFKNKVRWNLTTPFASFQTLLFNSSVRITLTHSSLSPKKEARLFIRNSYQKKARLEDFTDDPSLQKLLTDLVLNKKNILISGATGSGKTTFVKSLIERCPLNEHIIILEDTHEIESNHFNHTHLLSDLYSPNKSLKDYLAYAMRMSPNRIILGEMRSHEVIPFVLAMNTGHTGLMSTIHANSAKDSLHRLCLLFSLYQDNSQLPFNTILKLICQSVDYVVHIEDKKIHEIIKVQNSDAENILAHSVYTHTELSTNNKIMSMR